MMMPVLQLLCSNYRNAAAVLGTLYIGRLLLRELCGFLCGFRAFFLAPLGLGGGANLCKYGNWAGKSNAFRASVTHLYISGINQYNNIQSWKPCDVLDVGMFLALLTLKNNLIF